MCRLDKSLSILVGHARQVGGDVEIKPVPPLGALSDADVDRGFGPRDIQFELFCCHFHRAIKTGGIAKREQLLGVNPRLAAVRADQLD